MIVNQAMGLVLPASTKYLIDVVIGKGRPALETGVGRRRRSGDAETMLPLMSMADSVWSFWDRGQRVERAGYLVGALLLVSGLVHLGILIIGGGSWKGPLSLRKPATFGLSFGLTLITIVWVASFLPLGQRTRGVLLSAFTVVCALETGLVSMQAWRGVPSHFNLETTFDGLIRSHAADCHGFLASRAGRTSFERRVSGLPRIFKKSEVSICSVLFVVKLVTFSRRSGTSAPCSHLSTHDTCSTGWARGGMNPAPG